MLINLSNLDVTKKQAEELFAFIADRIPIYRKQRSGTPWDISYDGARDILADHDQELKDILTSRKDTLLRAYHCTRIPTIEAIRKEGLLQLNVQKVRDNLLEYAAGILGKPVPDEIIKKWLERTEPEVATDYLQLRSSSLGPAFTLGLQSIFNTCVRRYFVEGGETQHHIAPALAYCLKQEDSSFPYDGDDFLNSYLEDLTPALVICNIPYSELGESQQEEIRHLFILAWLYEETDDYPWKAAIEFHANRDIPGEWIPHILVPELNGYDPTFKEDVYSL